MSFLRYNDMKMFDKLFMNVMLKQLRQAGLVNNDLTLDIDQTIILLETVLQTLKDEKARQESDNISEHMDGDGDK